MQFLNARFLERKLQYSLNCEDGYMKKIVCVCICLFISGLKTKKNTHTNKRNLILVVENYSIDILIGSQALYNGDTQRSFIYKRSIDLF